MGNNCENPNEIPYNKLMKLRNNKKGDNTYFT